METKIEKRIPVPLSKSELFARMKVGDSFSVSDEEAPSIRVLASRHAKRLKIRLTVRDTEDGLRCWRIK